ncbi:MAG: hypothetical protein AB1792_04010 [Candidatus Zixiibacteriota bacterium]
MNRYRSHRGLLHGTESRADRTTIWLLVLVLVGCALALTFGEAEGAELISTLL